MTYNLNGSSQRIDFANIYDPTTGPFSVGVYFEPDNLAVEFQRYLWFVRNGTGGFGPTFWFRANVDRVNLSLSMSGPGQGLFKHTLLPAMTLGQGYRALLTYDGGDLASGVHIYLDNVELADDTGTDGDGNYNAGNGLWEWGGRNSGTSRYFDGRIGDGAVWDKVLSAQERAAFFAGAVPTSIAPASLRHAPRFRSNALDTISGLTGTLVGAPPLAPHPTIAAAGAIIDPPETILAIAENSGSGGGPDLVREVSIVFSDPAETFVTAATNIDPTAPIQIVGDFDGGNVDVAASSLDETDPQNPIVTLVPRKLPYRDDGISRFQTCVGRLNNVAGLQSVQVDVSDLRMDQDDEWAPNAKLLWRYVSDASPLRYRSWNEFETVEIVTSGSDKILRGVETTAFTGPIYVSDQAAVNLAMIKDRVADLLTDPRFTSQSGSADGSFSTLNNVADETGTRFSETVFGGPVNQFALAYTDGQAPDLPGWAYKRRIRVLSCVHPGEHAGMQSVFSMIDFLKAGSARALRASRNFIWDFVWINTAGLVLGAPTNTFDPNAPNENLNRAFEGVPILDPATQFLAFMNAHLENDNTAFLIDHHCLNGSDENPAGDYIFRNSSDPRSEAFFTKSVAHYAPQALYGFESGTNPGVSTVMHRNVLDISGITAEPRRYDGRPTYVHVDDYAETMVDTVLQMADAGDFGRHAVIDYTDPPETFVAQVTNVGGPPVDTVREVSIVFSDPAETFTAMALSGSQSGIVTPATRRAQAEGQSRRAQAEIDSRTQ